MVTGRYFAFVSWPFALALLAGLLVSEHHALFGFMERGYRGAIVLSIVLEAATMALLGAFLALSGSRSRHPRRALRWHPTGGR